MTEQEFPSHFKEAHDPINTIEEPPTFPVQGIKRSEPKKLRAKEQARLAMERNSRLINSMSSSGTPGEITLQRSPR